MENFPLTGQSGPPTCAPVGGPDWPVKVRRTRKIRAYRQRDAHTNWTPQSNGVRFVCKRQKGRMRNRACVIPIRPGLRAPLRPGAQWRSACALVYFSLARA